MGTAGIEWHAYLLGLQDLQCFITAFDFLWLLILFFFETIIVPKTVLNHKPLLDIIPRAQKDVDLIGNTQPFSFLSTKGTFLLD